MRMELLGPHGFFPWPKQGQSTFDPIPGHAGAKPGVRYQIGSRIADWTPAGEIAVGGPGWHVGCAERGRSDALGLKPFQVPAAMGVHSAVSTEKVRERIVDVAADVEVAIAVQILPQPITRDEAPYS